MRKKGFFNFRLFDGISDGILSDRIIRVHDDRIAGVEKLSDKDKYSDYDWTDLNGLTLMPGFTNTEALKAATSVNADIIGMSDKVGSIETGKHADFTIVKGDPITEISAVRDIQFVVKDGLTVFDKQKSTES